MAEAFEIWKNEKLQKMAKDKFDWDSNKMVEDENTAYDEVASEITDIAFAFIEDQRARILMVKKISQLSRLLNDDFEVEG